MPVGGCQAKRAASGGRPPGAPGGEGSPKRRKDTPARLWQKERKTTGTPLSGAAGRHGARQGHVGWRRASSCLAS